MIERLRVREQKSRILRALLIQFQSFILKINAVSKLRFSPTRRMFRIQILYVVMGMLQICYSKTNVQPRLQKAKTTHSSRFMTRLV